MKRAFYQNSITDFLSQSEEAILGELAKNNHYELTNEQRNAWLEEINLLQDNLKGLFGIICLEYTIPRMGKRVDAIVLLGNGIFVIEFKVGSSSYDRNAIDQVMDYALDLRNFHEQSASRSIFPILWATSAKEAQEKKLLKDDKLFQPLLVSSSSFRDTLDLCLKICGNTDISWHNQWIASSYHATPTIIEAAQALYAGHSVDEISRNDAGATNLKKTESFVTEIIHNAKANKKKVICFITGVPGAGKTLAGLNIANKRQGSNSKEYAVFLSGNGPLVKVLREALVRDEVKRAKIRGKAIEKEDSERKVNAFIQNIHHFRDEMLRSSAPPVEHVVIFDEAQRAWNLSKACAFMEEKRGMAKSEFAMSEPEFLLSVMDRHSDWTVVICLIGGGQEINTGEAGIGEWLTALKTRFSHWQAWVSPNLEEKEYTRGESGELLNTLENLSKHPDLHLKASIRSFRSNRVADFVKCVLDVEEARAKELCKKIQKKYPIVITRDISRARQWLREKATGSERYGLIASSGACRLKAIGVDVKSKINEIYWFLNDKWDVRSSDYLESVATEFHIQGLELDWAGLVWDSDLRYNGTDWEFWKFRGTKWIHVNSDMNQMYLKNAYRVLLTRARQGMVIVVPSGNCADETCHPNFYDETYKFLVNLGLPVLSDKLLKSIYRWPFLEFRGIDYNCRH